MTRTLYLILSHWSRAPSLVRPRDFDASRPSLLVLLSQSTYVSLGCHMSPALWVIKHSRKWADLAIAAVLSCRDREIRGFRGGRWLWTEPRSSKGAFTFPMHSLPLDMTRVPISQFFGVGIHVHEVGGYFCQVDSSAVLEPFPNHETPFPGPIMIPFIGPGVEHELRWGKLWQVDQSFEAGDMIVIAERNIDIDSVQ